MRSALQHQQEEGRRKRLRTDPFADLSVDEDQVVQRQNYFCCSAAASSEAEPHPTISPGQSSKREQVSWCGVSWRGFLRDLLESEEEISSESGQCDEQKEKKEECD